jgi:hypothetical protein
MNFLKLHEAIKSEFGEEKALHVCIMVAIGLSIKPKKRDFISPGSYTNKILKKSRQVLWELNDKEFNEVTEIFNTVHEWEIRQSMEGIGGCTKKTFKEILLEKPHESVEKLKTVEKPECRWSRD